MTERELGYLTIGCVEEDENTEEVTRQANQDTFIILK